MATAVKLSDQIINEAKPVLKVLHRSVAGQIEYWAKIGKIVEENPELNYSFIKHILMAQQEATSNQFRSLSVT